jgi:hypothetical protein
MKYFKQHKIELLKLPKGNTVLIFKFFNHGEL